eukprot:scaffold88409_cov42-Prasinocladus_malaysianus.AAC.1
MLDAGIEAGLELPYSCRGGICGACVGKVTSGEYDQSDGMVLACMCRPVSDCTVETQSDYGYSLGDDNVWPGPTGNIFGGKGNRQNTAGVCLSLALHRRSRVVGQRTATDPNKADINQLQLAISCDGQIRSDGPDQPDMVSSSSTWFRTEIIEGHTQTNEYLWDGRKLTFCVAPKARSVSAPNATLYLSDSAIGASRTMLAACKAGGALRQLRLVKRYAQRLGTHGFTGRTSLLDVLLNLFFVAPRDQRAVLAVQGRHEIVPGGHLLDALRVLCPGPFQHLNL